jgi:glycosyltransferase involved in cell wall biosynthesis
MRADSSQRQLRVLYSFPHKLGADRICTTAWHQIDGLVKAGVDLLVYPGAVSKPPTASVQPAPTLARGRFRIPYGVLGSMRAFALHDFIVSRRLARLAHLVDLVHVWPLGGLRTMQVAEKLRIPTVMERPNAHTRFAYEVVAAECEKLGLRLPAGHEHAYNASVLEKEEMEYKLAPRLLCPSDFVAQSFLDLGFAPQRLLRHQYGFDPSQYHPPTDHRPSTGPLSMLFVGGCAPRKGLHHALKAWLASPASRDGRFRIAGAFVPGYAEKLSPLLAHPSVEVLGHRSDIAELMRRSDILTLPSIEEGSALVTSEARGCGCVLLVSHAAGAICRHCDNALVHRAGDVAELTRHITMLHENRALLHRLRDASLASSNEATWDAAGRRLAAAYREVLDSAEAKAGRCIARTASVHA